MTQDKRTDWLKALKVGGRVGYIESFSGKPKGYGIISNITPTGKMDVSRYRFEPDGSHKSGDRWQYTKLQLVPITTEHVRYVDDAILKRKLIRALNDYDFSKLSLVQLQAVADIINEKEKSDEYSDDDIV